MKVIHQNNTPRTVHIGGVTIPPGEAREVDAADLRRAPQQPKPQAAEPTEADALAHACNALLCGTVAEIRQALPGLEDLGPLLAAEQAGANRKGVIEAIGTERLRRATQGGEA